MIGDEIARLLSVRGASPEVINLSAGVVQRGILYHATRSLRVLFGLIRILLRFSKRGTHVALLAVDGGLGIFYNLAFILLLRWKRVPILLYHHSTNYLVSKSGTMRWLVACAGVQAIHVMCSSKMADMFRQQYGRDICTLTVSNAAWVTSLPRHQRLISHELVFGHLSGLGREKGLDWAIATLGQARARGLPARLLLAGTPIDKDAEDILQKGLRAFPGSLTWLGPVAGSAKSDFFAEIGYFLFPSQYSHETQSLVVPEAMANGVPVIAYDHRFVADLVLPNGGKLVASNVAFDVAAIDWIQDGLREGSFAARKIQARTQFEQVKLKANRDIDRLLDLLMFGTTKV